MEVFNLNMATIKAYLANWYYTLRRMPAITRRLGNYRRCEDKIEIDVTYYCQLKCLNCNRSCGKAPDDKFISLGQIEKFIAESVQNAVQWKEIVLLGGEPLLHPKIFQIVNLLLNYKMSRSPKTKIKIVTNGFGNKVADLLPKIPSGIEIRNTMKQSPVQLFSPFNLAPQDRSNYQPGTYSDGCVNLRCGIGLSIHGYYCCSVAAGIDRVFGFNIGRKHIPGNSDSLRDQMAKLCKLCGIFSTFSLTNRELISPTWERAYKDFVNIKGRLSEY